MKQGLLLPLIQKRKLRLHMLTMTIIISIITIS